MPIAGGRSKKAAMVSGRAGSPLMMEAFAASPQRYIGERHKIEIITPESELQKAWESTVAYCGTIQCEVVSSNITTRTKQETAQSSVNLQGILCCELHGARNLMVIISHDYTCFFETFACIFFVGYFLHSKTFPEM